MWLKWRACYSHGYDRWSYTDIGIDSPDDYVQYEIAPSFTSSHFRKIEYLLIDVPPIEYLEKLVNDITEDIERLKQRKTDLYLMIADQKEKSRDV